MKQHKLLLIALTGIACGAFGMQAMAADETEVAISIENHVFVPDEVRITAGTAVVLVVSNKDTTVEEFESTDLRIERVIPGGKTVRIRLPKLSAGTNEFFGEYHQETAKGHIISE